MKSVTGKLGEAVDTLVDTLRDTATDVGDAIESVGRSSRLVTLLGALGVGGVATTLETGCAPGKVVVLNGEDADEDGYSSDDDCDDANAAIHPGAEEVCDEVDNDCDGDIDEDASDAPDWYPDLDGDGYGDGTAGSVGRDCISPDRNAAPNAGDCDDTDAAIHMDAPEVPYDGIDNDCVDGDVVDADADGFNSVLVSGGTDCDDTRASHNPEGEDCLVPVNVSGSYDSSGYGGFIEDAYGSSVLDLGSEGTPDGACEAAGYDGALAARVWDWYQCGGPNSSLALDWDSNDVTLETLTLPGMAEATDCAGVVMGVGAYGFDGLTPEGRWVAGDTTLTHPTTEETEMGLNSGAHAVVSCVQGAE